MSEIESHLSLDFKSLDFKAFVKIAYYFSDEKINQDHLALIRDFQVKWSLSYLFLIGFFSVMAATSVLMMQIHIQSPSADNPYVALWKCLFISSTCSVFLFSAHFKFLSARNALSYRYFCLGFGVIVALSGFMWGVLPVVYLHGSYHYLTIGILSGTLAFGTLWTIFVPQLTIVHLLSSSVVLISLKYNSPFMDDFIWFPWICFYMFILFALSFAGFVGLLFVVLQRNLLQTLMLNFENTAQDWRWQTDENLLLNYISDKMLQVTDMGLDELNGKTFAEILDKSSSSYHLFLEALFSKNSFKNYVVEYRKNDQTCWWNVSANCILGNAGEFKGFNGTCSDITASMQMQKLESDRKRYDSISELSSSIAHDFNNSLATIQGFLDLLERHPERYEDFKSLSDAARSSITNSSKMISQLLTFSKREVFFVETLDLAEEIQVSINEVMLITEEPIQFIFSAEEGFYVITDKMQLHRTLVNIINNSIESIDGRGKISVFLSRQHYEGSANQYIKISIKDTGSGIPEKILSKIYEPFFTTKRHVNGTGLGLSMAKGFVEQSGGFIEASSTAQGATISLYLVEAHEVGRTKQVSSVTTDMFEGIRFLLVEDNRAYYKVLNTSFKEINVYVDYAANVADALKVIEEKEIEFLITDFILPDGTGMDVAQAIRESNKEIPVLFISGYIEFPDNVNINLASNWAVVKKPFQFEHLCEKIGGMIGANST